MDSEISDFNREVLNKYRAYQKGTIQKNKKKRLKRRKARRKNG